MSEDKKSLINLVPNSVDNAVKNITDKPTQNMGTTLADIWYLVFGNISHATEKRKLKYFYALQKFENELKENISKIPEDKLAEPDIQVIAPALEAAKYCVEKKELRNLYANLLAKAMNSDTKDMVHPSFVEIIKQMSPIDSLVFKTIMERQANPIVDLVYNKHDADIPIPIESQTVVENVTDINIAPVETVCICIDNLVKQGLISISEKSYTNPLLYDNILKSQFYIIQQQKCPYTPDGFKFSHNKKRIVKTNLGNSFYEICVKDL